MSDTAVESLEDLPPSAKLVYKVLEHAEDTLTQDEIGDRSRLSEPTVRYALDRLQDAGYVRGDHDLEDVRRKVYQTVK